MNSLVVSSSIGETVRAAFPFSVDKYRLHGPDNMPTDHFGLFRSDSGKCVGAACRRGYEPHTTDDVVALAESAAAAFGAGAVATCGFDDGHYLAIAPSREQRVAIFGTADNVWPRLIVRAPFDGHAFTGSLGYYRDACRNMSVIRSAGQSYSARIVHRSSLRERMNELVGLFSDLAAGWQSTVDTIRALDSRRVELAAFLREVYPAPAADASRRTSNSYDRRLEAIIRRIAAERVQTGRGGSRYDIPREVSAWEAFNGVQGYVQHDANRRGELSAFDRAMVALGDSAVARALDLALAA